MNASKTRYPEGDIEISDAGYPGLPLRIHVVSDLHIDVAAAELRLASGADMLVVAGDTCEGVERGFAWLRAAVPAPTPIVAVAGNHEHYRHVLPEQLVRGRIGFKARSRRH